MTRAKLPGLLAGLSLVSLSSCSDVSLPAAGGGGSTGSVTAGTGGVGSSAGESAAGRAGNAAGQASRGGSSGAPTSSGAGGVSGSLPTAGSAGVAGSTSRPVSCTDEFSSSLPELPSLGQVTARIIGNRARLRAEPFAGAKDYRAYVLPSDAEVSSTDGLVVQNATYRCAGEAVSERGEPLLEIEWPEVAEGQVVVVEALDAGCPFVGHLAYKAVPAGEYSQAFLTPEQARDRETRELFINGQFEPENRPQPIARSYVCMEPAPPPTMDYFEDFSNFDETVRTVRIEDHSYQDVFLESASFDISFQFIEPDVWSVGAVDGQLWVAYADWAADTASKFRATTRQRAALSDSTFVHATMAVDAVSTHRRYPQLWLSTAAVPVQNNLDRGVTLNVETFGGVPNEDLLLQICDHRSWDVQEQCPTFYDQGGAARSAFEWEEYTGVGLPVRFDLFVSTKRAYVFYDSKPAICANLPQGAFQAGDELSMTIGDVLYHSGVDEAIWEAPGPSVYRFHSEYQPTETRRVFDDLGLSSGVPQPEWDEGSLPCVSDTYEE